MNNIDKKEKVTELGLLDLGLRENGYEQDYPERGYKICFNSWEPKRVMCSIEIIFPGLDDNHSVTINTNHFPVIEIMRRLKLKVYGDLEEISPDLLFEEFYLKSDGFLYFFSTSEEKRMADIPEIQTLEDVQKRAMVLAEEEEAGVAKYNLF